MVHVTEFYLLDRAKLDCSINRDICGSTEKTLVEKSGNLSSGPSFDIV